MSTVIFPPALPTWNYVWTVVLWINSKQNIVWDFCCLAWSHTFLVLEYLKLNDIGFLLYYQSNQQLNLHTWPITHKGHSTDKTSRSEKPKRKQVFLQRKLIVLKCYWRRCLPGKTFIQKFTAKLDWIQIVEEDRSGKQECSCVHIMWGYRIKLTELKLLRLPEEWREMKSTVCQRGKNQNQLGKKF